MGHFIELASLLVMLAFLAVVLSVVGFSILKLLRYFGSQNQMSMTPQRNYAAAKSRADKRSAMRA